MKKLMIIIAILSLSTALHGSNIGICIGPRECAIAIYDATQKTVSSEFVPLIIYFQVSGAPIVGHAQMLTYLKKDPTNCVANIMELLEQSGKVQKEIVVRGKKYLVQDLLQIIFQYVRSRITSSINQPVVVAIPTHLSYNQREIVHSAIFNAGLRPVRLVNATTAAAIRYINNNVETGKLRATIRVADALHNTVSTFNFTDNGTDNGILYEKDHKYHITIDEKTDYDEIIFSTRDKSDKESCNYIAMGAASYAAIIDKDADCKKVCLVVPVMPYALNLKTPDGLTQPIIAQNKDYPYKSPIMYYNITKPKTFLSIYQDENKSEIIKNIPMPGVNGQGQIRFDIDMNGLLSANDILSLETERMKCLELIQKTQAAYYANKKLQKRLWFWQRGKSAALFWIIRKGLETASTVRAIHALENKILQLRLQFGITGIE